MSFIPNRKSNANLSSDFLHSTYFFHHVILNLLVMWPRTTLAHIKNSCALFLWPQTHTTNWNGNNLNLRNSQMINHVLKNTVNWRFYNLGEKNIYFFIKPGKWALYFKYLNDYLILKDIYILDFVLK